MEKYKTVDHLPSGIKNNIHHVIVNEKDYIDIYFVYHRNTNDYGMRIYIDFKLDIIILITRNDVVAILKQIIQDNRKRPYLTIQDTQQIPYLVKDLKRKYTKHFDDYKWQNEKDIVRQRRLLWQRLGL